MVSGRASFELTQKAMMAGIPVLAAVSAPSSLAAELATEVGMTLVAFLRGSSMVLYAGSERIVGTGSVGTGSTPAESAQKQAGSVQTGSAQTTSGLGTADS